MADSLADDDKESTSSSQYFVTLAGFKGAVGKNAASMGVQQSIPNRR